MLGICNYDKIILWEVVYIIIKNADLIMPDGILEGTDVEITDGLITNIAKGLWSDNAIDARDCYVSPGFVDIHTHGGYGCDFMDDNNESFRRVLDFHRDHGTTSVVASTATASEKSIVAVFDRVRRFMKNPGNTARVLGCHVEGPYISFKNKGAQNPDYLRIPADDDYGFITDNADVVKNVTISPELDGAPDMTAALIGAGIRVSGGHDDATAKDIYPVIEAGMTGCTHWYCAMSTAKVLGTRRSAGLMEIGLADDRLCLELLADNHHLVPELVKIAYVAKGAGKLCLVSDSLRCAGMEADGRVYTLGAQGDDGSKFVVDDGVARMADGTRLAGSIQPVSQMVRNLVFDCGIPLCDAVRMASLTPAEFIGVSDKIGSLKIGKRADLCILDRKLNVQKTIIGGKSA